MLSVLLFFLLFFFLLVCDTMKNSLHVFKYENILSMTTKTVKVPDTWVAGKNAAYIVNELSQTESINVHNYYWYV